MIQKLLIFIFLFSMSSHANEILPIPQMVEYDSDKAKLGKKLYFDTRLSADNTIACVTCHNIEAGGDDNLPASYGIGGQVGEMNAPTVLNAYFNFRQFWNGRVRTLQNQAKGSIQNKVEMGHEFPLLVKNLRQIEEYQTQFMKIYPEGITEDTIVDAIAEFEKTLITPNAKFDKYLNGQKDILSDQELNGYQLFKDKGCIACHHGINVGGNLYAKIGIVEERKLAHKGLYDITKNKDDLYMFKVPGLRNVEHTAPYGFVGQYPTLERAVADIAYKQLGVELEENEIEDIIAFLKTLSGEVHVIND